MRSICWPVLLSVGAAAGSATALAARCREALSATHAARASMVASNRARVRSQADWRAGGGRILEAVTGLLENEEA